MNEDVYRIAMYEAIRPEIERHRDTNSLEISGSFLRNEMKFHRVGETTYPQFDVCDRTHAEPMRDTYGFVFANQVLEHVRNPFGAVRNMEKLLRVGGVAMVTTVCMFPRHDEPADYWRFTPDGLRQLFDGYKDIHVGGWGNRLALRHVCDWRQNNTVDALSDLAKVNEPDCPIVVWAWGTKA